MENAKLVVVLMDFSSIIKLSTAQLAAVGVKLAMESLHATRLKTGMLSSMGSPPPVTQTARLAPTPAPRLARLATKDTPWMGTLVWHVQQLTPSNALNQILPSPSLAK